MTRIGLIADTHHYLDETIFQHFKDCDEVWHAGDFGTVEIADKIKAQKILQQGCFIWRLSIQEKRSPFISTAPAVWW